MRLTDEQVEKLQPTDEEQRIHMGRKLYLYVLPSGKKEWWFQYWLQRKSKNAILLGQFPLMSVNEAWSKTMEAYRCLQVGKDISFLGVSIELPSGVRTRQKVSDLKNRVTKLEQEVMDLRNRMVMADMDDMGSIVRTEINWLQEQIDILKPKKKKKKIAKKKEKVPKKRKKKVSR